VTVEYEYVIVLGLDLFHGSGFSEWTAQAFVRINYRVFVMNSTFNYMN